MNGIQPASAEFNYPWMDLSAAKIIALCQSMTDAGFGYELGAKINPIDRQALDVPKGKRFVDCSGFTEWALNRATDGEWKPPINFSSLAQLQYFRALGFKVSTPEACKLNDGAVRLAVLTPEDAELAGLGRSNRHVMLIPGDGHTCESHGGAGPSRRDVDNIWRWFQRCQVVVLTPPK